MTAFLNSHFMWLLASCENLSIRIIHCNEKSRDILSQKEKF